MTLESEMQSRRWPLACVVLCSVAFADEPQKTYATRTFEEWCVLAEHDLELETRTKAVTGLTVLGKYGREDQTVAILQAMIERETDRSIVALASQSIVTYGDRATPTVLAALKSEGHLRLQMLSILENLPILNYQEAPDLSGAIAPILLDLMLQHVSETPDQTQLTATAQDYQERARVLMQSGRPREEIQEELRGLIENMRSAQPFGAMNLSGVRQERATAFNTLRLILKAYPTQEYADLTLRKLMVAAKSNDLELACLAIQTLGALGENARLAVPLLIEYLDANDWQQEAAFTRRGGSQTFRLPNNQEGFGGTPQQRSFTFRGSASTFRTESPTLLRSRSLAAAKAIRELGPVAIDARDRLEKLVKQDNSPSEFNDALAEIQTAANQRLQTPTDSE